MCRQRNRMTEGNFVALVAGGLTLVALVGCGPITILDVNQPPTAAPGADRNIEIGKRVTLDGSASLDADDDPLSYHWGQKSGPQVNLDNAFSMQASFVPLQADVYTFVLIVTDGRGGSDEAEIRLATSQEPGPSCPRADAGARQSVSEGSMVILDGSFSSHPIGSLLTFEWNQVSGAPVPLSGVFTVNPRLRAPETDGESELKFELTVRDESGCARTAMVSVFVIDRDINDPCADVSCTDDGIFCNGAEFCLEGECHSSGNPCPVDQPCNETTGTCESMNDCSAESCDDGLFCNGPEACADDRCVTGTPPCPENAHCDEADDGCYECLANEECTDDLFCNGTETCVRRVCHEGTSPCGEGEVCDEPNRECRDHCADLDCDDDLFCNGVESCAAGVCQPGLPACAATLMCDETNDICIAPCIDADCDDGEFCNGAERCADGYCVAGTAPCTQGQSCDEAAEQCVTPGAEIEIVAVHPPSDLIGGIGPRDYAVEVRNKGIRAAQFTLSVTIGAGIGSTIVDVPAHQSLTAHVSIPTPASFGGCGQSNNFEVRACAEFTDGDVSNNCQRVSVPVAVPYWDLDFDIVSAPSSARRCSNTRWTVKVTNHGNVPSMNVCAFSGIGAFSGAGNWASNLGLNFFTTPNIGPGQNWTHRVDNYFVGCLAFLQTQYIKVEVNYSAGCFDHCSGGNYGQDSIVIR